jgi:HlyD family secretion protein
MRVQDPDTKTVGILPPAGVPDRPAKRLSQRAKPPKSTAKRWWVVGGAAVVLIAAAIWLYTRGSGDVQYVTGRVDRGDMEATITATGNCNAVVTVQVGSQVSGNIIALYADFNTKVKKGQLVARIDPAPFQARVDQAKANRDSANAAVATARANVTKADADIANAQANVATQKANLVHAQSAVSDAKVKNDRRVELLKQGIIAQEDANTAQATYDQAVASLDAANAQVNAAQTVVESTRAERTVAQAQLDSALASVKQNEAALRQAQLDLDHTSIVAPVDGTVVSRNMDVGQTVAASFQAPVIFQIAQDLTKMQVDTNVDESDVGPVRVGQPANFTVDAYPGNVFHGNVAQIRKAPINVQNVITYDVVVQVANPDLKLFPGMTANVKIVTDHVQNALRVPAAALRFHPAQPVSAAKSGQRQRPNAAPSQMQAIYVPGADGKPQAVRVKLGINDGTHVQVLEGNLKEGQAVIVGATGTSAPAQQQGPARTRRFGF